MPVNKITADQFVDNLESSILSRNDAHDVEIGPIADVITEPSGQVFESQNDRIRTVSQLILLDQSAVFEDVDVESFVKNEELVRNLGGKSSGTEIFSRAAAPSVDITVQRGFPIATQPDTSSGETVVFVTTEEKTLPAATASTFFNLDTNRYELEVAIQATVAGKLGEVGPNRITRPLRTLVGFDDVYNRNRTSTVTDRETNTELIERYKLSILGTQLAGKNGLELFILSNFQDSGDVRIVTPGDPLITRSGINGNAVDAYITGSQSVTRQDTKEFIGIGQLIVLDNQPVQNITLISGFIQNVDYEFIRDTSGVSNSIRAQDGIRFLSTATTLPTVGSNIVIDYEQNILVENIQNALTSDPDNIVGGQDQLIRTGTQIDIVIAATLTVLAGFSFTTIRTAVTTEIINFINALGLGDDVEQSDLQAVIRNISGVDNFIFTLMDRTGGSGNSDVSINLNEFARTISTNITIT
jgi:uncharacterized phage protein gp47/JayE